MTELERLKRRFEGRLAVYVVFLRPADAGGEWDRSDLWDRAAAMPGVTAVRDVDGLACGDGPNGRDPAIGRVRPIDQPAAGEAVERRGECLFPDRAARPADDRRARRRRPGEILIERKLRRHGQRW